MNKDREGYPESFAEDAEDEQVGESQKQENPGPA